MKKLKVNCCDMKLLLQYLSILGILSLILDFINWSEVNSLISISKKISEYRIIIKISILCLIYICLFLYANFKKRVRFSINNTDILLKEGNLFEEKGLKVIAFNEYFDTIVDDVIIANSTLNGYFISNYVANIEDLDNLIENDIYLNEYNNNININRKRGKQKKYSLGSIFKYKDEYLLTALTRFNNKNEAFLELREYYLFLLKFWEEISRVYAGKSVIIPLLGSGITRFQDFEANSQDLLRMMLLSLKISRIRYTSGITIVLSEDKLKEINLYHLKELIN